jgi:hypothetical protein
MSAQPPRTRSESGVLAFGGDRRPLLSPCRGPGLRARRSLAATLTYLTARFSSGREGQSVSELPLTRGLRGEQANQHADVNDVIIYLILA